MAPTKEKVCSGCGVRFKPTGSRASYCSAKCILINCSRRTESGCLEWTRTRHASGYGGITVEGKVQTTHRLSYSLFVGEIPTGMFVCHTCDNRGCIEPSHLFLGSNLDNVRDMVAKKRHVFGKKAQNAKLTDDDVRMIRSDKRPAAAIARELGVSPQIVQDARNRVHWKHID